MFIIDFDDTLFDTHRFKLERFLSVRNLGIDEAVWAETYKQARNDHSGLFTYSDRRHAQFLGVRSFDEELVFKKLSEVSNRCEEFLFSDAIEFLDFLKTTKQRLILLSLGDPNFQEFKVNGAKIHNFFDHVFFEALDKKKVIEKIFKFEPANDVWFINDKVSETRDIFEKYGDIRPVLKVCNNFDLKEYQDGGLPFFKTLTEIKNYVASAL